MLTRPEPACLVIADIAGYTSYLAGVELDHAQDILADLINIVVGALRPTFRLAKLEGDAAFAYVMTEKVDPSLLQDVVERTYFAFRRRLRDIAQSSTCDCDACTRMPTLDLKLIVHHGTVVKHKVAGRDELAGADVIVVHRLLKNHVEDLVGRHAYALYTDACIRAMDADPVAMGLREHHELLDVGGDTTCWVRDLDELWQAEMARTVVRIEAEDAAVTVAYDVPVPPAIAWEWVTSPARRPVWGAGITGIVESSPTGRRGAGTTNHCMHGKDAIVEEVLDWRPFEHFTTRSQLPDPGMPKVLMTDVFVPLPDGGTRIEVRIGKPRPKDRAVFESLGPMYQSLLEASAVQLQVLMRDVAAELSSTATTEPAVEASQGRHLLAS